MIKSIKYIWDKLISNTFVLSFMKKYLLFLTLLTNFNITYSQNVGIVRKNYISSIFDSSSMSNIDVFDSSTIRLGRINPTTGNITNIGNSEYKIGINLTGATLNPYLNHYYIASGNTLLTFDMNTGNIINNVPITGPYSTFAFQNFRFNTSDSIIYGMVPNNFYSTYFDSTVMDSIVILDSTQIRFASINPRNGKYTIIGNTSYTNLYTLAGNSIDPFQMVYYYSAVDTLVGIDLYTGNRFSNVKIQLPSNAIFENISYSCIDTAIYGITRQTFISTVYDSLLMTNIEVIDSTTFRLSKINPNTGFVDLISPYSIGYSGNLSVGSFIDPSSFTFYLSDGIKIIGVSLSTGLVTSIETKTFSSGAIALNMIRSTENCYGTNEIRINTRTGIEELENIEINIFPNPAQNLISVTNKKQFNTIEIIDYKGLSILKTTDEIIDISILPQGIYILKLMKQDGNFISKRLVKN